jgi:hypothetical protein
MMQRESDRKRPPTVGGGGQTVWGGYEGLLGGGYTCLPNLLLERYAELGLTPTEVMVIIHIWQHWWDRGRNPFPALGTIAARMGLSTRQVRHHIAAIRAKGLLTVEERRVPGRGQVASAYVLTPLLEALGAPAGASPSGAVPVTSAPGRQDAAAAPRKDPAAETDEIGIRRKGGFSKPSEGHPHSVALSPGTRHGQGPEAPTSERIMTLISDLSTQFNDGGHTRSNCTRAHRLWAGSGLDEAAFLDRAYEARRAALRAVRIRHAAVGPWRSPNRMPYFFAVLSRLLAAVGPVEGERSDAGDIVEAPSRHPIWSAVLAELEGVLTRENYQTWLAGTQVVREERSHLYVAVPQPFHAEWLRHKLHGRVTGALRRLGYDEVQVHYVVAAAA